MLSFDVAWAGTALCIIDTCKVVFPLHKQIFVYIWDINFRYRRFSFWLMLGYVIICKAPFASSYSGSLSAWKKSLQAAKRSRWYDIPWRIILDLQEECPSRVRNPRDQGTRWSSRPAERSGLEERAESLSQGLRLQQLALMLAVLCHQLIGVSIICL